MSLGADWCAHWSIYTVVDKVSHFFWLPKVPVWNQNQWQKLWNWECQPQETGILVPLARTGGTARVDAGRNVDQDDTCEARILRPAFLPRRGLQDGGSSAFCRCPSNHIYSRRQDPALDSQPWWSGLCSHMHRHVRWLQSHAPPWS